MKKFILLIGLFLSTSAMATPFFQGMRDADGNLTSSGDKASPVTYDTQDQEVTKIRRDGDGKVIVTFGDGHQEDFYKKRDGTWKKGLPVGNE